MQRSIYERSFVLSSDQIVTSQDRQNTATISDGTAPPANHAKGQPVSKATAQARDDIMHAVDEDELAVEQEDSDYMSLEETDPDHRTFTPRGTLLFLLVMLVGYALYWAYLWFIVVIERGAGG
jgi:hypothetical protein